MMLALLLLVVGCCRGAPEAFYIDVPNYRQHTDFSCGDASLQMVLAHFNIKAQQSLIANVARTSPYEGTLSLDIHRAAQFSSMSSRVGNAYSLPPGMGWSPFSPLGLYAGWRDGATAWLDNLYSIVASGAPVIVLHHYDPNKLELDDGHFRVVVGYNKTAGTITMNDPWPQMPARLTWNVSTFVRAWNYTEPQSPRTRPYFGAAIAQWALKTSVSGNRVTAALRIPDFGGIPLLDVWRPRFATFRLTLAFERPFNESAGAFADVPVIVDLSTPISKTVATKDNLDVYTVSWLLNVVRSSTVTLDVSASGLVHGDLPGAPWNATVYVPGYSYDDTVGVSQSTTIAVTARAKP